MCLMSINAAHILTYSHNFFPNDYIIYDTDGNEFIIFWHLLLVTFSLWPCRPSFKKENMSAFSRRTEVMLPKSQTIQRKGTPQTVCRSSKWSQNHKSYKHGGSTFSFRSPMVKGQDKKKKKTQELFTPQFEVRSMHTWQHTSTAQNLHSKNKYVHLQKLIHHIPLTEAVKDKTFP